MAKHTAYGLPGVYNFTPLSLNDGDGVALGVTQQGYLIAVNPDGTNIGEGSLGVTIQTTGIAASGMGDNTIVSAGGVGKSIYVFAWNVSFSGTVNAQFTDGAAGTVLNGLMYGSQNAGGGSSVSLPTYLWAGSANTALILNLSAGVAVGGSVSYYVK
jgi:hypothetical protein